MTLTRSQWLSAIRRSLVIVAVLWCSDGLVFGSAPWFALGIASAVASALLTLVIRRTARRELAGKPDLADGDYVPPPRMLAYARPAEGPGGMPALEMGCDCGVVTVCVFDFGGRRLARAHEIAMTCDGCHSVRWLTVRPAEAGDSR